MARILVIEDDVQMRKMLEQTIQREGHQVDGASNGEYGLEMFHD